MPLPSTACVECGKHVERVYRMGRNTVTYKGGRIHNKCYLKLDFSGRKKKA